MHWKLIPASFAVLLFWVVVAPAHAQVEPDATQGGSPLVLGAGYSNFDLDYGQSRRMQGITAWADWHLRHMPGWLDGLSIEAEGRDINFGRPASLPIMRQDTILGGALYQWSHYRNFKPYGKYLAGLGSIDFPNIGNPSYTHDTRTVFAPGGGFDYYLGHGVSFRADYEYQFWRHLFGPYDLNPNGVTVGVVYSLRARRY